MRPSGTIAAWPVRPSPMAPLRIGLAGASLAVVWLFQSFPASAAPCGVFTADEGDNEIYYGLVARKLNLPCPSSPFSGVAVFPEPTYRAAICWRDVHGDWNYEEMATCNTSTPAADALTIMGGDGDDVIMPITHRGVNDEFVCPIPGTSGSLRDFPSATPPEPHSPPMYEWYERERTHDVRVGGGCTAELGCPYLPMGVSLHGGPGADQLFGAPTSDQLTSADVLAPLECISAGTTSSGDSLLDLCVCSIDASCCSTNWGWDCANIAADSCGADCSEITLLGADESLDLMCGQGGEDTLLGDLDAGPLAYEMMSGGRDSDLDTCRGVGPVSSCCSATSTPG